MKNINIDYLDNNNASNLKNFLEHRLYSAGYRGTHLFQHNRLSPEKILALYYSYVRTCEKFQIKEISIPKGDEKNAKNKGFVLKEYPQYQFLVSDFNKKMGQGTANSIKKNIFPDLERLDVINSRKNNTLSFKKRFQDKLNKLNSLSEKEIFINDYVNSTVKIYQSDFLEYVTNVLFETKTISIYEFMLIVSWFSRKWRGKLFDIEDAILLIKEFRKLSTSVLISLIGDIKNFATPDPAESKGKTKKDFGNWKNETQEIMDVFRQFYLFKSDGEGADFSLILDASFSDSSERISYKRSAKIKEDYFKHHKILKNNRFQLDHIVPFGLIKDNGSYSKIEDWKNLIYIDANTHAIKTTNGNKYMKLELVSLAPIKMKLSAYDGDFLELENNRNVIINEEQLEIILKYNELVLKAI